MGVYDTPNILAQHFGRHARKGGVASRTIDEEAVYTVACSYPTDKTRHHIKCTLTPSAYAEFSTRGMF